MLSQGPFRGHSRVQLICQSIEVSLRVHTRYIWMASVLTNWSVPFDQTANLPDADFVWTFMGMQNVCGTEAKLLSFLARVWSSLKDGGVFLGAFPNGSKILWVHGTNSEWSQLHLTDNCMSLFVCFLFFESIKTRYWSLERFQAAFLLLSHSGRCWRWNLVLFHSARCVWRSFWGRHIPRQRLTVSLGERTMAFEAHRGLKQSLSNRLAEQIGFKVQATSFAQYTKDSGKTPYKRKLYSKIIGRNGLPAWAMQLASKCWFDCRLYICLAKSTS